MKVKSWVAFLLFFLFFMYITDIHAQKKQETYQITWKENLIFSPYPDYSVEFLHFEGASRGHEYADLPLFYAQIPVDIFFQSYNITLQNVETAPFNEHDASLISTNFDQKELKIDMATLTDRHQHVTAISFIPILKSQNGNYVKVTSVTFSYEGVREITPKKAKSYAANSVLSSGNWYKIAVSKAGLHKVTYDDLVKLGINVSGLRSENIALFGNGTSMLPENTSGQRPDDIIENAIKIFDGGDGSFDQGDYFIFYAQSPHTWNFNQNTKTFSHKINVYSDNAYYYVNVDAGIGTKKRVTTVNNNHLTANKEVDTYTHYDFYEKDETNLVKSGRIWVGDKYDYITEYSYTMNLPAITGEPAKLRMQAAFLSSLSSSFAVTVNGISAGRLTGNNGTLREAILSSTSFNISPTSSTLNIDVKYSKSSSSVVAYLDWFELQATCLLRMHSSQFPFCNIENIGIDSITQYHISNSNANTIVWDVTEPGHSVQMQGELVGSIFSFKSPTSELRKFVAFNGSDFIPITTVGKIKNQNLHGDVNVDMVIVSHSDFLSQAERLAEFRRTHDGYNVKIVTPQEIYNEFSSGMQDPTAIRDYMKMIYDVTGKTYPKYLLFFGRPSYDYRGRSSNTKLFVPHYLFEEYYIYSESMACDDYFGKVDDNESATIGLIDIAVGRFPVTTAAQANVAVTKTINYSRQENLVKEGDATRISNLADWRNVITFVADDQDSNTHINETDNAAKLLGDKNKTVNIEKIYLDAYTQVSHSGGQRYPDVNDAINKRVQRGNMMLVYHGHGGVNGLAHERVVTISDINTWNNYYNQMIMVTLTCDFAQYDREATSPGELVFLNSNGGAVGLITTSRVAFMNSDYSHKLFNQLYVKNTGTPEQSKYKTLGELNRASKNQGGSYNMIIVLGDPALPIAIPNYSVVTDSINGVSASSYQDTLKAFNKVTMKGRVVGDDGAILSNFNGNIYPSIYDKAVTLTTLQNDLNSPPFDFELQKNILFRGNATVKNGHFEFTFIVPKDINYAYGNGKVSYYARTNASDASGYFDKIIIGGISDEQLTDSIGPEIEVFLNDRNFVNGGIVNPSPMLIVDLKDEYGINTTGNGIGHDLVAVLDNATEAPIILNDYYETQLDSFNSGTVRYPLKDIPVGKHTLKIRAWDIANNVSEKTINFEVISDEKLALDHVLNYPNPFTTRTEFYFEQNQAGGTFDIIIQIFTISGKLVKTISTQQHIQGNRSQPIFWNGRDDYEDKLAKGVYLYKLKVRNQQGEIAEKIEKIVIL